ncbi:MAG TPA: fused MFS/spermidine synthase [Acidimicrobiia bacterium]|nr:fused MFS/spermidine synthase [Acidimicrobiia bacterium]
MPALLAAAIVFVCSAAVLMLEILAGRLLAPYVGISLQTYTSIIGTVLAGIAVGAWGGGKLADRIDPRRLLGPTIALGGVFSLLTVPVIRSLGSQATAASRSTTIFLAFTGFFLPAVVLSAVTPMVVKLQLKDLHHTGGVVGRLSGISTLGALVGTFVTGFVLVATVPTRTLIGAIGGTLVVAGVGLGLWLARRDSTMLIVLAVLAGAVVTVGATTDSPCQVESAYYCIRVEHDVLRPSGRILWLDDLMHSYVDLKDPTFLGFDYTKSFSDAIAVAWPDHRALDALHIGGGGFTMPRYLAAEYPGTRSTVLEIDPSILKVGREELGLHTSDALQVRIGDARLGIRTRPTASADLVVGDAFASLSVPWHLATREFVGDVHRVLRPGGLYVANVIDYPPFRFARAELATFREQFEWVAVIAPPTTLDGQFGGNIVLVASDRPLDTGALGQRARAHGDVVRDGTALDRFVGNAPVIRDDFAPVDQWLDADKN